MFEDKSIIFWPGKTFLRVPAKSGIILNSAKPCEKKPCVSRVLSTVHWQSWKKRFLHTNNWPGQKELIEMERNGKVVSEILYSNRRQSDLVSNAQNAVRTLFSNELRSRGAEIIFPPGARAEITNKASASTPFYLSKAWRNFIEKNLGCKTIRVKNASNHVKKYQYNNKKCYFQGIL